MDAETLDQAGMAVMTEQCAEFRFYAELNDFLRPAKRYKPLRYRFRSEPGIKDPIEALGVPHAEVELIVVNGASVGFDYRLRDRDRVAVYPVFESVDVTPLVRLREAPLRRTTFVVDVNLGKLARLLRMLGFDVLYRNDYSDAEIVRISVQKHRIILTRDRRLLRHGAVTHGYWVRSDDPADQVEEILRRFDLYRAARPLQRCIECNGLLEEVSKEEVLDQLEPLTKKHYQAFHRCPECGRVYWQGSHVDKMQEKISKLMETVGVETAVEAGGVE
ncbi:MAG: Mut7-C RNAse domain-containing protein [Pseudomonadota bacterium]|nr:Mut7-C RNAse domain-containing protein [Pseudomonadota bacterium]